MGTAAEVVVYTSLDQEFSEPILKDFEKKTGIKVRAAYDVEASKTTGLVNRLLAEKERPKCDVFWSSEVGRTLQLKQKGVLAAYRSPSAADIPEAFKDPEGIWTGFASRMRVLIYNTGLLKQNEVPQSIFELTQAQWKGMVSLAYPLFGTTATHVAALYAAIGTEKAESFLKELQANGVVIVDGNSVTRDLVAEGRVPIGFTDTDDANVAVTAGKPVGVIYPDRDGIGTLLIPNTVTLVKGGPNPAAGKTLIDYLLSREVESRLAFSPSAQIPVRPGVKKPTHIPDISTITVMPVTFEAIAQHMERAGRFCQQLFIR